MSTPDPEESRMSSLSPTQRDDLVLAAYRAILERVAAGTVTKTAPHRLLTEVDGTWAEGRFAPRLAVALVDYARRQCPSADEPHATAELSRDFARRCRVYAITQTFYEEVRLQMPDTQRPSVWM
jgi:hypothetical protein